MQNLVQEDFWSFFNIITFKAFALQGGGQIWPQGYNLEKLNTDHKIQLHAKFCSPRSYGFRQEDFQRFPIFFKFCCHGNQSFWRTLILQEILKRTMAESFLGNFFEICSFRQKNVLNKSWCTYWWTDRHTMDSRPWHVNPFPNKPWLLRVCRTRI